MHNLHLARIRASSHTEAEKAVEIEISHWGNENNWRNICGSVCETGTVNDNEQTISARFPPTDMGMETIEKINSHIRGWVRPESWHEAAFKKVKKMAFKDVKLYGTKRFGEEHSTLYYAKQYLDYLLETADVRGRIDSLDCLKDSFYEWKLDECGVTGLDTYEEDDKENLNLYIVFIDMHS